MNCGVQMCLILGGEFQDMYAMDMMGCTNGQQLGDATVACNLAYCVGLVGQWIDQICDLELLVCPSRSMTGQSVAV